MIILKPMKISLRENESVLYFVAEVEKALLDYIEGPRTVIAKQAVPDETD